MKALLLLIFLFWQTAYPAEQGVFWIVKGKVWIEGANSKKQAQIKSIIQAGETVITENDSRAKIVMSDRNIINVSPNTKLKIETYINENGKRNVSLNLIEGKVRNNVEQKYDSQNNKFEIRTATAVAGVRGTQFLTTFDKATRRTEVITFKGEVYFRSLISEKTDLTDDAVIVAKGKKSESDDGQPPTKPFKLPDGEFKQIDKDSEVRAPNSEKRDTKNEPKGKKGDRDGIRPLPTNGANPIIDLNKGPGSIIDQTIDRKFEKSRIKIITNPQ